MYTILIHFNKILVLNSGVISLLLFFQLQSQKEAIIVFCLQFCTYISKYMNDYRYAPRSYLYYEIIENIYGIANLTAQLIPIIQTKRIVPCILHNNLQRTIVAKQSTSI